MILIVARNNLHLTKIAVKSALQQYGVPCRHVLVIDNDSSDGTSKWLQAKSDIHYVSFCERASLSTCWNYGLECLWNLAGPWPVLVINNDVELWPGTYHTLYSSNEDFITAIGVRNREALGRNTGKISLHPDFSCFMISPFVFRKVGKFDESYYPAYCEDCDYHVRMHRAGIKALSINVPFYHEGAQTLKQAKVGEAAIIHRGAGNNRKKFQDKYGCLPGTPEYEALFT